MMKKLCAQAKLLMLTLLFCGLLTCGLAGCALPQNIVPPPIVYQEFVDKATDILQTGAGQVLINEDKVLDGELLRERREYAFPDGDVFYQERISLLLQTTTVDNSSAYAEPMAELQQLNALMLTGETGMLRYYDYDSQAWVEQPLAEGLYPVRQYFIDTAGGSLILVPPQAYQQRENQTLEYLPLSDGAMQISHTNSSFNIAVYMPEANPHLQYEYMYLLSGKQLIDWENAVSRDYWQGYLFDLDNRWCWSGYYYTAPANYIPSGDNYYHRLPAAYIVSNMAYYDNRAAKSLCLTMLDIMLDLQNEKGYFPTYAGSEWLLEDYQIGPGFYDTRFNSDLVQALDITARKYQVPRFVESIIRYGEFYLPMAIDNHYTLTDDMGGQGWLVYDYWHPEQMLPNLTSLNHQAAEIITLFALAEISGNNEYLQLAEYMLQGLTMLGDKWLKSDYDLHYAYLGNGEMGLRDYPYLTYNDLYHLQNLLEERWGGRNPQLQQLMDGKKIWMDKHNISGYKK